MEATTMLFSAIVTVYNVEDYLEKCVQSIIAQQDAELEIILVDDGSIDKSGRICDCFAQQDDRVRVIHQENQGLTSARKKGLEEAKGDYIFYVDADDWITPDMCREYIKIVEKYQPDVVVSGLVKEFEDKPQRVSNLIEEGYYENSQLHDEVVKKMICTDNFFEKGIQSYLCIGLIRKEIIDEVAPTMDKNMVFAEGGAWLYSCILKSDSVYIINGGFYHYRMRANSISHSDYNMESLLCVYECLLKNIVEYNKEVSLLVEKLDCMILYFLVWKYFAGLNKKNSEELFPFLELPPKCKIVLYGGWHFGRVLYSYIKETQFCDIVLWVDKNALQYQKENIDIYLPEKILEIEYDYILLATELYAGIKSMKRDLEALGINERIVHVEKKNVMSRGLPNDFQKIKEKVLESF